jgi:hypothetical protein
LNFALVAALVLGCARPLPVPPSGDHGGTEPMPVPYPPPAARVDIIPYPPEEFARPAWIDGQWVWRGRRWVWEEGRWIDLAPNQVYAKPMIVRRSDGQLVWFAGTLRTAPSPSSVVVPARSPEAEEKSR